MGTRSLRALSVLALTAACLGAERAPSLKEEMKFGVEAAEHGLWREAIFRWEKYLATHPDSSRLRNNLAVAYESLGEYDKAEEQYKAALGNDSRNKEIRDNYDSFKELYRDVRAGRSAAAGATPAPAAAAPSPGASPPAASPPPGAGPSPPAPGDGG
jgi:Tfp pilus assembly protein PilF